MIREVPLPLVRANQTMLIIGTLVAIILRLPMVIYVLFFIALAALLLGPRANLAFRVVRPIFGSKLAFASTEAAEIQRFNQIIAVTMLFLSSIILLTTHFWVGYIFAGFVTIAATSAVCGYCIGCTVYFRYKIRTRLTRQHHPWFSPVMDFIAGTGPFRPPLQERYQPILMMALAHEAFRQVLKEIEAETPGVTPDTLPALIEKVNTLARAIELHAEQEDLAMYPPFEAKRRGITQFSVDEHVEVHHKQHETEQAMAAALADPATLGEAKRAILEWVQFNRQHVQSEEDVLMPWVPRLFTSDEGAEVVRSILARRPEEYETFHLGFVFSHLESGQKYMYASILYDSCPPEQFSRYENVLQALAGSFYWKAFKEERREKTVLAVV